MQRRTVRWEYIVFTIATNALVFCMLYIINVPLPAMPNLIEISPIRHVASAEAMRPLSGIPTHISIPSLSISLAVQKGSFNPATKAWTLSDTNALYADASIPANDSNGTTLIYAHARWGLFGDLPDIKPGAMAIVDTNIGHRFYYRYKSQRKVSPTDTSVFTGDGAPKLVLQTCQGPWDVYRGLYSFQYTSEKPYHG